MQKAIVLLLLVVSIAACNHSQVTSNSVPENPPPSDEALPGAPKTEATRQYVADGKLIRFYTVDSTEFPPENYSAPLLETGKGNSAPAKKNGCYVIDIESRNEVKLCDQPVEEYEDQALLYELLGGLSGFPYWVFQIRYYEGGSILLVNQKYGTKAYMGSVPVVSPDRKRLLAWNEDLETFYDFNGFEMFRVEEYGLASDWKLMLDDWGPVKLYWKSDGEIWLKARILLESGEYRYEHYRMEVEDGN